MLNKIRSFQPAFSSNIKVLSTDNPELFFRCERDRAKFPQIKENLAEPIVYQNRNIGINSSAIADSDRFQVGITNGQTFMTFSVSPAQLFSPTAKESEEMKRTFSQLFPLPENSPASSGEKTSNLLGFELFER